MPLQQPLIIPFSAVFIGDSTNGGPLTRVNVTRTGGTDIEDSMETRAEPGFNFNGLPIDTHKFVVTVRFYGDDDILGNICLGQSITSIDTNGPIGFTQYSLFLQSPVGSTRKSSYYIPVARTVRSMKFRYGKDQAVGTQITFIAEHRDPTVNIRYKDLDSNLITQMGAKSPI